jgi:hypothetical protein
LSNKFTRKQSSNIAAPSQDDFFVTKLLLVEGRSIDGDATCSYAIAQPSIVATAIAMKFIFCDDDDCCKGKGGLGELRNGSIIL